MAASVWCFVSATLLGLDSFGINWFSDTSDGKTHALTHRGDPVAGLVGLLKDCRDGPIQDQAIEALARGHRDCVMPLDEFRRMANTKMPLEKKSRMVAFLIARNRPRKLSPTYERNHNLANREYRIILLSSSERALTQIARAAGEERLGGEEVRFLDVPASDDGSSGIVDGKIKAALGKTIRETTKDFVESLRVNAIKYQGHAFRATAPRKVYFNDPANGLSSASRKRQKKTDLNEMPCCQTRTMLITVFGAILR